MTAVATKATANRERNMKNEWEGGSYEARVAPFTQWSHAVHAHVGKLAPVLLRRFGLHMAVLAPLLDHRAVTKSMSPECTFASPTPLPSRLLQSVLRCLRLPHSGVALVLSPSYLHTSTTPRHRGNSRRDALGVPSKERRLADVAQPCRTTTTTTAATTTTQQQQQQQAHQINCNQQAGGVTPQARAVLTTQAVAAHNSPRKSMTTRSKPMPPPPCGNAPYRKESMYALTRQTQSTPAHSHKHTQPVSRKAIDQKQWDSPRDAAGLHTSHALSYSHTRPQARVQTQLAGPTHTQASKQSTNQSIKQTTF